MEIYSDRGVTPSARMHRRMGDGRFFPNAARIWLAWWLGAACLPLQPGCTEGQDGDCGVVACERECIDTGHAFGACALDECLCWGGTGVTPGVDESELGEGFSEQLSTVLRGIEIREADSGWLDLPPGYYRIRHFRDPSSLQEAITLNVLAQYGVCADDSQSMLHLAGDELVFYRFERYDYDSAGWGFTVADASGRVLDVDAGFSDACITVFRAELEDVHMVMTAQTFTTGRLWTCGRDSEPAWTVDGPCAGH